MSGTVSDVRKRAWETRRAKYGSRGHDGAYTRPSGPCPHCRPAIAAIIELHAEGVLSEGQAAKMTGMDRVAIRIAIDSLPSRSTIEKEADCGTIG